MLGFILVFGIVSILLVLGMLAFNKAQAEARHNVIDLRAQSVGTRIASLVVQTSLAAEQQGVTTQVRFLADLPAQLEGLSYTVYLEAACGPTPPLLACPASAGTTQHVERVRVAVPAVSVDITAPIFSADAPTAFEICSASAPGGRVFVAFNINPIYQSPPLAKPCLYIEAAP